MTSPVSLYQQEKARRGIELPRATGCPRNIPVPPIALSDRLPPQPRTERTQRAATARNARWDEWRKLYERDDLMLTEIAALTGYSYQAIQKALVKMGVKMRGRGGGEARSFLSRQNKVLRKENAVLKYRVMSLRSKLSKYEAS